MFSHLLNEIAPPRQSIWSKDDSVPKPPSRRESNAVSLPLRQRALEPMLLAVTPIKHVGNQDDSVRWMGTNSSFSIYDSGPSGRMWQDDSGILFPDAHLSISGLQASGLVAHESSMHESSHLPGLTHLQVSGYSMVDTVDHTFADYIDVSSSDFQATAPPVRLRDESANWQTEPSILEKSIARPAPPPRKSSCTPRPSFDGKDASMSTNIDGTDYHTASSCSLVHVLGPSSAGAQASDSVHCSQTSITQAEGVTNSGEGSPLANAVAEDIASAAPVVDSRERFQTAGCAFTPTNVGIGPMPVRARASDVHHLPNQSARCDSTVLDDPSIVTTLDEADKYYSVNYSGNAVVDRCDDDPEHSRPLTSHVNLLSEATAKQRDGNQGPQTERREPLVASSGVTQWFQAITPFPPLTSPPCPLSHGTAGAGSETSAESHDSDLSCQAQAQLVVESQMAGIALYGHTSSPAHACTQRQPFSSVQPQAAAHYPPTFVSKNGVCGGKPRRASFWQHIKSIFKTKSRSEKENGLPASIGSPIESAPAL